MEARKVETNKQKEKKERRVRKTAKKGNEEKGRSRRADKR